MKISVIIPAYNEEDTISRCLKGLLDGPRADQMEIVVVCNGCRDNTAETARRFEPRVKVIELTEGSKILALNTGDSHCSHFPRFYIDADIVVTQESVWTVAKVLADGEALAAAPSMVIDTSRSSRIVQTYYKAWRKIPYSSRGMLGSGIYAVSEQGRKRFSQFPDVIGDDAFFRLQFSLEERKTVTASQFTITAPRNLFWLVRITTRAVIGNIELKKKFPELFSREEGGNNSAVARNIFSGRESMDFILYAFIRIIIKINAKRKLLLGTWKTWAHDPTARTKN